MDLNAWAGLVNIEDYQDVQTSNTALNICLYLKIKKYRGDVFKLLSHVLFSVKFQIELFFVCCITDRPSPYISGHPRQRPGSYTVGCRLLIRTGPFLSRPVFYVSRKVLKYWAGQKIQQANEDGDSWNITSTPILFYLLILGVGNSQRSTQHNNIP